MNNFLSYSGEYVHKLLNFNKKLEFNWQNGVNKNKTLTLNLKQSYSRARAVFV